MVQNRSLVFVSIPDHRVVAGDHVQIQTSEFDVDMAAPDHGFTAHLLYASLDPYLRNRMVDPDKPQNGFEPLPLGSVIPNGILVKILKSEAPAFPEGALAVGMGPVQEYLSITREQSISFQRLPKLPGIEPRAFLGPLGLPGLTGFAGLYEVGKPQGGQTIFVSAASGAVGQMVGQLAKREGMRVIGSAGSAEKVKMVKEIFEFDEAFNHRDGNIAEQLRRAAPEGIDIYYDNVGAQQLEAAIENMNELGRIVACGYASEYGVPKEEHYGIHNVNQVIRKRITWRGIEIFHDGLGDKYRQQLFEKVGKWISDGSIKVVFDMTEGIENAPQALASLMAGTNIGKVVISTQTA